MKDFDLQTDGGTEPCVFCDAEVVVSKLGCISEPKTCFLGPLLPVDANGSRVESALWEVWSRHTETVQTILVYLS